MDRGEGRREAGSLRLDDADPFASALRSTRMAVAVTDPKITDNPIVFVNDAFLAMTGYERAELLGRNCRLLQGPGTDPAAVAALRDAIGAREAVTVEFINYRKTGEPFWNELYVSPIHDETGALHYFIGMAVVGSERRDGQAAAQAARTAQLENAVKVQQVLIREIDHRVKNNLQMVSAMLMLQALSIPDPAVKQTLQEMLERVEALALVHKRLYELSQLTEFDLDDYIRELVHTLAGAAGRADLTIDLRLDPVVIGADAAASVALILNEALTNAFKHAFKAGGGHALLVDMRRVGLRCVIAISDDGPGMPAGAPRFQTFGTTLIETLTVQLSGTQAWTRLEKGTRFSLDFPLDLPDDPH